MREFSPKVYIIKKVIKNELRQFYGTLILFFYYVKWFILIGLPWLYYGLDYKDNLILDLLWIICLGLIIKDFIYTVILKKSYCKNDKSLKKRDTENR